MQLTYTIGVVRFVLFSWWCPKHVETPINTSLFLHLVGYLFTFSQTVICGKCNAVPVLNTGHYTGMHYIIRPFAVEQATSLLHNHWQYVAFCIVLLLQHPPTKKMCTFCVIWRTLGITYVRDLTFKQENGMRYCFTCPLQIIKMLIWKWQHLYAWHIDWQYVSQGQFTLTICNNTLGTMFYSRLGARSMADSKCEEVSLEELSVSFDKNDAITRLVKVVVSSVLLSGMRVEPPAGCTKRFRHS
jgi:hypothetical protein